MTANFDDKRKAAYSGRRSIMDYGMGVIIAGFGRTGQSIAKVLEEEKIPYHALDLDPQRVQEAQAAGSNVSYGDTSRRESLLAAGIHRAAALVVAPRCRDHGPHGLPPRRQHRA